MVSADMIRQHQEQGRQQQGGWVGETNVGEVERLASTVGGGCDCPHRHAVTRRGTVRPHLGHVQTKSEPI